MRCSCIFIVLALFSGSCAAAPVERPVTWAVDPGQWILKVPVNQWLILDPTLNAPLSVEAFQARLGGATVVFIGEQHDQAPQHRFEAWVLEQLVEVQARAQDARPVTLALEMLRWPEQPIFDAYDRGELGDEVLRQEWSESWGKDWPIYEPLLAWAASPTVRLLALNAPRFLSRRVFEVGVQGLSEDEQRYLPPNLDDTNKEYRDLVLQAFYAHAPKGHGNHGSHGEGHAPDLGDAAQRFFHAQLMWDETMSHTLSQDIAQYDAQGQEPPRYLAVAGGVHVMYGWGVPSRLAKVYPEVAQLLILCVSVNEGDDPALLMKRLDPQAADLFCLTRNPHPDTRSASAIPTQD